MKIKAEVVEEMTYDELMEGFVTDITLNLGDIIVIKKDNNWFAQFVVLITTDAIYLHVDSEGLDGDGLLLWPDAIEKLKRDSQRIYEKDRFIHIPIEREQNDHIT